MKKKAEKYNRASKSYGMISNGVTYFWNSEVNESRKQGGKNVLKLARIFQN